MARIAIVGPGAIGGTVAAWLCQAGGHEVTICARTPFEQLSVTTPDGRIVADPKVATRPEDVSPVDWILVATKTYDAAAAAGWFPALSTPATWLAVLQNGVEHVERFASLFPANRTLPVVVECPAERERPGVVHQRARAWLAVPRGASGSAFGGLFEGTALDVVQVEDFKTKAWTKLCLNAAGVVSAILLRPAGIVQNEGIADLMRAIVREVVLVGRAEGAKLDDSVVEHVLTACRNAPPDGVNSLHADRQANRATEIDARNGVVVRLGRRHGIPTPYNAMAVALVSA